MPQNLERISLNYKNLSQQWVQSIPNYTKQYCNIYLIRLTQMTQLLQKRIEKKWGKKYPFCKLHKLSEEKHQKCVVIGTLFKDQKLKPSILKQLAESNQLVPQPIVTHFTDKSDQIYIEDELQRYLLLSCLQCDYLVTGISCALLGSGDDQGRFTVEDFTFADFREQIPRPKLTDSVYLVFISGLDLINCANFTPNLQLFEQWIMGLMGNLNGFETHKISKVIIAGNCIRNRAEEYKPSISMLSKRPESTQTIEAVKVMDKFLYNLSQTIDVDVMPGECDPTNNILPQKPMHYCMFPESSQYKTINQVSNPYYFSIGDVKILGTSGQPVRDILRYSEIADPLDALESCLRWNHLAPTAPDTLGCYPFYENDPFIIEECPHVFFAGNQQEFGCKESLGPEGQKVTLISVPEFSTTLQACILDLKSLNCEIINFNI